MEKAMAPHSSTLAWKIPWTEEPGRLQSWGCKESDTTEWLHFHFSLSFIGEGNGNPLQCSSLENPRDGGAWWAAVYRVARSQTRLKRLSSSSSIPLQLSSAEFYFTISFFSAHILFQWDWVLFLGLSCPPASVYASPSSWYMCLLPSFSCHNPYLVSLECPILMNSFLYDLVTCHFSFSSSTEHQWNIECCSLCSVINTTLDNMRLGIYHTTIKKELLMHASLNNICGIAINNVMQQFI